MLAKSFMPDLVNPQAKINFIQALLTLKRCGVEWENVRLFASGTFENYRGEVVKQEPEPKTEITPSTQITLWVGFPSLFDSLPYQTFFGAKEWHRDTVSLEHRARRFLACFDSSFIRILSRLEYVLLVYNLVFLEKDFCQHFLEAFGFPASAWKEEEILLWMTFLPTFHLWAGTKEETEKVLSTFLQTPFKIEENIKGENQLPPELKSRLGEKLNHLGQNWLLGSGFSECDSTYRINIGPISVDQIKEFLPEERKRKKLERILALSTPGQLRYRVSLKLRQKDKRLSLGKDSKNSLLGYATYLS